MNLLSVREVLVCAFATISSTLTKSTIKGGSSQAFDPYELLQLGKRHLQLGDAKKAHDVAMTLLRHDDNNASSLLFAGRVFVALQQGPNAERCFRRAVEARPDRASGFVALAEFVAKQHGRSKEATVLADKAVSLDSENPRILGDAGLVHSMANDHDRAYELYQMGLEIIPNDVRMNYCAATSARFLGFLEEAEAYADKALQLDPTEYEGLFLRSDVRKQTIDNNHIEELEARIAAGVSEHKSQYHHYYVLAKELEDIGEYEKSFAALSSGAEIRRKRMAYKVQTDTEIMSLIEEVHNQDFIAKNDSVGHAKAGPIFIVGMPRTGTTLLERVVSSHSNVTSAGELNTLSLLISADSKLDKPALVRQSVNIDFNALGEAYVAACSEYSDESQYWIDKLPVNFLYCGLIKLAMPNAKIINLNRNPMDTCYANYKMLFNAASPFSYSLNDLGEYYAAYYRLMQHWNEVLPGFILTVSYENITANLEREARRVLEFCGLGWEDGVLEFHKNKQASTTASASQVRQPVYSSSVHKWRNYETQLKPLQDILEKHGVPID